MTDRTKVEFIVIKKPLIQAVFLVACNFCVVAGLIGIGVYVGSSAMQWAGFAMAVVLLYAMPQAKRMTRDQAIAYLQTLEA